jgi:hypothetical protein
MEFGKPLEQYLGNFADKYFNEEGMEKIKNRIVDIANTIKNSFSFLSTLAAIGTGASIGAKMGAFLGPKGVAVGTILGGLGGFLGLKMFTGGGGENAENVNDFKSKGGSHLVITPSGQALKTNPKDTVFGTTSVNDFMSGPAGSMSLNNKELINEIRLLREEMTANTSEVKRTTNAVAGLAT